MSTSRVLIVGAGSSRSDSRSCSPNTESTPRRRTTMAPSTHPAGTCSPPAHWRSSASLASTRICAAQLAVYELRDGIYATSLTGPELGRITIYDPDRLKPNRFETLSPTRAATVDTYSGSCCADQLEACKRVEFHRGSVYQSHHETLMALKFESPA